VARERVAVDVAAVPGETGGALYATVDVVDGAVRVSVLVNVQCRSGSEFRTGRAPSLVVCSDTILEKVGKLALLSGVNDQLRKTKVFLDSPRQN
jgi:hypothetical protein